MIYVIRDAASGLIKIGFTASDTVKARLHDYATHCPGPVVLLRTIDGDRSVELDMHALLHPFHYRAEWFRVTEEQIEAAVSTPGLGTLYVNTREAARIIQCDNVLLYHRCVAGKVPGAMSVETGSVRRWFVPRAWVEQTKATDLTPGKAPSVPSDVVPLVVDDYRRGDASIDKIAKRRGFGRAAITTCLMRAGVEIRPAVAANGGTRGGPRGSARASAILSDERVHDIRRRIAAGERHGDIARDHGVSTSMISRINTGRAWAHVA